MSPVGALPPEGSQRLPMRGPGSRPVEEADPIAPPERAALAATTTSSADGGSGPSRRGCPSSNSCPSTSTGRSGRPASALAGQGALGVGVHLRRRPRPAPVGHRRQRAPAGAQWPARGSTGTSSCPAGRWSPPAVRQSPPGRGAAARRSSARFGHQRLLDVGHEHAELGQLARRASSARRCGSRRVG